MIDVYRNRYGCPVGLSDHSGKIYAGLAASVLGIDMIEVHVAFHRTMFGPDVVASLTPEELGQLVDGVRFNEAMRMHPVDKDAVASELEPLRGLFFKSIVASSALPAGTVLQPEHLAFKKPGNGIPAERMDSLIGRTLSRDLAKDELLQQGDPT